MDDFQRRSSAKSRPVQTLTREEAANAFEPHDVGRATPSQMGGLLMGLRLRGETVDEITGAVTTMRAKMTKVAAPPDAIDVVGTGGDASGFLQYFHLRGLYRGGRRHSGRQARQPRAVVALRRADVLGALGVKIDLRPDEITRCIYRGRHRLHVRSRASSCDEAWSARRASARHAHDLQSARAAVEPGRVKRQMVGVSRASGSSRSRMC